MTSAVLAARGVAVAYGGRPALEPSDLTVRHGELVAVVGPNGAGKSSLLAALAGTVQHEGTVLRCGCTGAPPAPTTAYLPQAPDLRAALPLSVDQVVSTGCLDGRRWWRRPDAGQRETTREAMERLGVIDLRRRPFGSLSGGQARRVLLARALVQRPRLMILDEPHAGLDLTAAEQLNAALAAAADTGIAVVASVHDLELVRRGFQRSVVLQRRIVADGPTGRVLPVGTTPWAVA